jgi:3-oxoacyl-[acyl-carrier protein] reductase
MVRTLATAGADVAVHYRSDKAGAEDLVVELQAMGRRGCAVYADISDRASIATMQTTILAELGAPDIVVTNAVQQVAGGWKTVLEQDEEAYMGQFQTCVMQNVLMAKAFVPAMQNKQWGREHSPSVRSQPVRTSLIFLRSLRWLCCRVHRHQH